MYFIKEMPKYERPREKLVKYGASKLSNIELLAILLRTGNKEKSVLELAKDVLYKLDELSDLKNISINELLKIRGIKIAKASTIIAAIELGRRLDDLSVKTSEVSTSHDIYLKMRHLKHEQQEQFYAIMLNTKLKIINTKLIYKGTVNSMVIHPREIFKEAIKSNASYIIIVHNHPTGDSSPSTEDKTTTKNLEEVANIVGIEILDHIIIGNNEYYSFNEMKKHHINN